MLSSKVISTWTVLRESRAVMSHRAIAAVSIAVMVVIVLFATRVAGAERAAAPVPLTVSTPGQDPFLRPGGVSTSLGSVVQSSAGAPGISDASPPGASGGAPRVVVHVVGHVKAPGLVELTAPARVQDAITAAGGTTRRADPSGVNLARLVLDGEQIRVPAKGEALVAPVVPVGPGGLGSVSGAPGPAVVLDLNLADLAALDALPGIGPVLAARILAWRAEHGRFTSVDELSEVSGIGDAVLARLTGLVRV